MARAVCATIWFALLAFVGSTAAASPAGSCPSLDGQVNSTFSVVGQWCASQQLLTAPDGTVIGELDYVFISNKRNFVVGGNWFLHLPKADGGQVVSRTRQSNSTNASQIVEDVLDCNNQTVLSVEIDNSGGISFDSGAATTFWVFNGSASPPVYLIKLLATRSSLIRSNEMVAYACPSNAVSKTHCGGSDPDGHSSLRALGSMTTPWLNLVVQRWTFECVFCFVVCVGG